jgi:FHA domain/Protein of unknown function (DUF3662)
VSWLARMEEACAAFIERAFAKTFPSDLEPAHIARRLVATMEARSQQEERGMSAPGRYVVRVHASDFERLSEHRAYLEREWSALLADVAGRVGIRFPGGEPSVTLERSAGGVVPGAMEIEAVAEPAQSQPRYILRMIKGVPPDGVFALEETTSVGRNEDRTIFLVDPSVSRNHAVIAIEEGVPVLLDMGSRNGTFVNGDRVRSHPLAPGDVVNFGNTQMRLETVE